jgi:hypothetical protein
MSPEQWQQVKDLFAAALERGRDRDAWLGRVCGEDAALRNEVESLLAAHDGIGDFRSSATHPRNSFRRTSADISAASLSWPAGRPCVIARTNL